MSNMSKIIEKTFSSIPSLLGSSFQGKTQKEDLASELKTFIHKLSSCNSKQEEENLIRQELNADKEKLSNPHISFRELKECLTRALYCHLVGYDVSFAFFHAVKLATRNNVSEKIIGYMLCSIFLSDTNELALLLICNIQMDLKSDNILIVYTALTVASQLVNQSLIPDLLEMVTSRLRDYNKAIIRKKSVICLHSFYKKAPEIIQPVEHLFEKALCDEDPGVMWAAVHVYLDLVQNNPQKYRAMTNAFTDIIIQIVNRKLPSEYDYHSVPAPWLTIHLLKILAKLGSGCEATSKQIYPAVKEVLQRIEPTQKMGLAVILECVDTICAIFPHAGLLEVAANCVTKFITAKNINLRYLGLRALSNLVTIDPKYALSHQQTVIECLEHNDETLQRQTFTLLYKIANPSNIPVISAKLLLCLQNTHDNYTQKDLVQKVLNLCKRYKEDPQYFQRTKWFFLTTNRLIFLAPNLLPADFVSEVVTILEDKTEPDHKFAVNFYWTILQEEDLLPLLIQLGSWIVSKYWRHIELGSAASAVSTKVTSCLLSWLPRCISLTTQKVVLKGLCRVLPHVPQEQIGLFVESVESSLKTRDRHVLQILKEIKVLSKSPSVFAAVMNTNKDIKMDFSLSFLDNFVIKALEDGAVPYKPPALRNLRNMQECSSVTADIELTEYESKPALKSVSSHQSLTKPSSSVISVNSQDTKDNLELKLTGVKQIWGKSGINKAKEINNLQVADHSEKQETTNTAKAQEKSDFQAALFSGITTSTMNNTSISDINIQARKDVNETLSDTSLLLSQSGGTLIISNSSLGKVLNTTDYSAKESTSSLNIDTAEFTQRVSPNYETTNNSQTKTEAIGSGHQYTNVLRDLRDFETDSLDGCSPDYLEGPPLLFESDDYSEELGSQPLQMDRLRYPDLLPYLGTSANSNANSGCGNAEFSQSASYDEEMSTKDDIDQYMASAKQL